MTMRQSGFTKTGNNASSLPRIIDDNNSYGEMGGEVPGMRMIALSPSGFAVFCAPPPHILGRLYR
jgi:hypothetical protein